MILLSIILIYATEIANCAIGDNVVPSQANINAYDAMVNHVKALRGHIDGLDIRKEMEYITYTSTIIYRRMFTEFFGGDRMGYTELPPINYPQFPAGNSEDIYVLGSGSFARYEATGSSDLDVMIVVIKPPSWNDYQGIERRNAAKDVCREILVGSLGYSRKLEEHAHIYGAAPRSTGALALDIIPGCHVKKSIEEFVDTALLYEAHDPQSWNIPRASQFIDSFPLYLAGNANYHKLQQMFWRKITTVNMKSAYQHYMNQYFNLGNYKTNYANHDKFSAKEAILRPLTLPIVYFYNLAFHQHNHHRYAHPTTSTLERLYFLAEWGYIEIGEIQAVEHTFLWGSKNQLKANVLQFHDGETQVHHGKEMTVINDNRQSINDHVGKVVQFMSHISQQYVTHFH